MAGFAGLMDIQAWTDDNEHNQDADWYTFAAMYPVAAEWLRDVESRRAGHIRRIVGTSQVTRLRHLSVRDDDEFIRALCGVRTRGIGSELLAESSMLIARPFRICPKCKGIAKGGE